MKKTDACKLIASQYAALKHHATRASVNAECPINCRRQPARASHRSFLAFGTRSLILAGGSIIGLTMSSNLASAAEAVNNAPTSAKPAAAAASSTSNPLSDKFKLPKKPAWLTDLSLSIKEGYDDNIYGSGVPPLEHQSSWFTVVSPKIGFNLAPLISDTNSAIGLTILSLGYAPDFTWYGSQSSEDNYAHSFPVSIKGKASAFSYYLDNTLRYVDGSDIAPAYANGYNVYGFTPTRERREQIQNRSKIILRYDWEKFFVRPAASFLYYDMMTAQLNPALATTPKGYMNYEDRYDVNGGLDFGYKITDKVAGTLGYRRGHQEQSAFVWDPTSLSNDYDRLLFGVEGSPLKWLKFEAAAGPDFHYYNPATMPVGFDGPDNITPYSEASVNFTFSPKDALTIKYKGWQWVNSTGKSTALNHTIDLNYKRKITNKFGVELTGRVDDGDYSLPTVRHDWHFSVLGGLRYAFNPHLSADLDYSVAVGWNAIDNLANENSREFTRQIVSLALRFKY
jgi:hypothetical protein